MAALEIQANQLGVQAAQDCERMAKDRTMALQMLQKVSSIYLWHYNVVGQLWSAGTDVQSDG